MLHAPATPESASLPALSPSQLSTRLHQALWQLRELGIPYRIHADDLGLSPSISAHILECFDRGALQSASVIVNSPAAEAAVAEALRRPNLRLHLHLNWSEGPPLAPPDHIPLLLDAHGQLCVSFGRLLALMVRHPAAELTRQLVAEARAQRRRFAELTGHPATYLDSHIHVHLLPPAFAAVLALHAEVPLHYVRLPREPWLWLPQRLPDYVSAGPVKHLVLQALIRQQGYANQLARAGIATCDVFVGVLFTGRMDARVITAALPDCFAALGEIEFLFHPGQATPREVEQWAHRPELANYYTHPGRQLEKAALLAV